jgi:2'-5' RNA ligase
LLRSFLAIELPEAILKRIGEVQRVLKSSRADVRWVSPQNIHLTLKFFGSVEESKINSIAQSIEEPTRTTSPLWVTVRGIGAFPGLKSPRVIWVGLHDEKKILISFQSQLDGELQKIGFQSENRPFHPHLTLGRMRSNRGRDELVKEMEKYREEEFGSFQAERVVLFKSDLRPEGAIYTRLKETRLGEA